MCSHSQFSSASLTRSTANGRARRSGPPGPIMHSCPCCRGSARGSPPCCSGSSCPRSRSGSRCGVRDECEKHAANFAEYDGCEKAFEPDPNRSGRRRGKEIDEGVREARTGKKAFSKQAQHEQSGRCHGKRDRRCAGRRAGGDLLSLVIVHRMKGWFSTMALLLGSDHCC